MLRTFSRAAAMAILLLPALAHAEEQQGINMTIDEFLPLSTNLDFEVLETLSLFHALPIFAVWSEEGRLRPEANAVTAYNDWGDCIEGQSNAPEQIEQVMYDLFVSGMRDIAESGNGNMQIERAWALFRIWGCKEFIGQHFLEFPDRTGSFSN